MRSENDIRRRLDDEKSTRSELEKKICKLMDIKPLTEGDVGVANFYNTELKKINSKIEAWEWVLDKGNLK